MSKIIERVIKFDRSVENFDREKIIRSIMKAGGSRELGERIADVVEEKLRDQREVMTTQIRRVILIELEKDDRDVRDTFLFYDRLVKGRITFETGKFFIVRDGALFLGKSMRDISPSGLHHLDEVYGLLSELDEDTWIGVLRDDMAERRIKVLIEAIENSQMSREDKEKAIELVNNFQLRWFGKE